MRLDTDLLRVPRRQAGWRRGTLVSMPFKTVLHHRRQLAELWLPWCVDAENPALPLAAFPALHPRAAQLRLTDLDTPVIQSALARQPYRLGDFSWPKINELADGYRAAESHGEPVIVDDVDNPMLDEQPTVMRYGDVTMLCEGSHRSSALWVSGISVFELRLACSPCSWAAYENDELRIRGRPFQDLT